jgi:glyoxylate reductase
MHKVFITRRLPRIATTLLKEEFEVDQNAENRPHPAEDLQRIVAEYDAVLSTVADSFGAAVLGGGGRLSVISNYAVGLDNIDLAAARSAGITVYNTPDVVTESTADLTFGLLLALVRRIPAAQRFVREGRWASWDPELFLGEELCGKTLGIWGFGKLGQAVARRALGFGLEVIFHSHGGSPADASLKGRAQAVSLDEMLARSDYLSIHLPLNADTRGIVNADVFAAMERQPVMLNMARGGIVDTADLLLALERGVLRGCGLDVSDPEPLPGDHPLCQREDVLLVPHIGTATLDCREAMAALAARNIINHFR